MSASLDQSRPEPPSVAHTVGGQAVQTIQGAYYVFAGVCAALAIQPGVPVFRWAVPVLALAVAGEPSGLLRGKAAVGAYWRAALDRFPDLRFELLGTFAGVGGAVVHYRSVRGLVACEAFAFDAAGKVCRAAAHYSE